jgi:protein phosphatase
MIATLSIAGRRGNNEDALVARNFKDTCLLAVADGVGGHVAGEIASRLAVAELEKTVEKLLQEHKTPEAILHTGYTKANMEIFSLPKRNPKYQGMATTLVSALIQADEAVLANLGDSRAYLLRKDSIQQLTKDHSLVQELVDRGEISPEEAFGHPERNIITKALGLEEEAEPDILRIKLNRDDILLLCTDGLSDTLRDAEIKEIVINSENLEKAARSLVETALREGGQDNITVLLYET